jgi:hypothetical protein
VNRHQVAAAVAIVALTATGCSNGAGDQSNAERTTSSSTTEQPKVCDTISAAMDAVVAYQANQSHSFDAHTRKLSSDLAAKARTAAAAAQSSQDVATMAPALTSLAASIDALTEAASNGNEQALRTAAGDYLHARVELDQSSVGMCSSTKVGGAAGPSHTP